MSIKGWPTQEKDDRLVPQYATVEPVRTLQNALSVLSHEFVREVGTDAVEANSTVTVINATGHAAQVGDVIRITSGTLSGQEVKVYAVGANTITLAEELPSAPAALVTFQVLRHKYPVVEATGEVKVTGTFTEVATAADGGALPALTKVVSGYDGSAVQVIKTDANGELQVDVLSSALPTGAATSAAQTDGTQKTQIVDGAGDIADVKLLSVALVNTDKGLVTNTVIHGETTGGGGGYVDVKVTPSGSLTTESTLAGLDAAVLGQDTMANSLPVVIASNQSAIPITDNSGSITVDGTVAATQSGTWNITNVSGTISLPTGAATETTLGAIKTSVELLDNAVAGNELQVDIVASLPAGTNNIGDVDVLSVIPGTAATNLGKAIDSAVGGTDTGVAALVVRDDVLSAITPANDDYTVARVSNLGRLWVENGGRTAQNRARIDYTSSSVTTSAYTQLLASTSAIIQEVEIFDSSGQTLVLATGGAGAEADQVYILPGGNGRIPLYIAASTRVAIKAVSATANAGEISVNFYGG